MLSVPESALIASLLFCSLGILSAKNSYAASNTKTVTKVYSVTKTVKGPVKAMNYKRTVRISIKATVNTKTKKFLKINKVTVLNEAGNKTSKVTGTIINSSRSIKISGTAIMDAINYYSHQGVVPVQINRTFSYSGFMNL